MNELILTYSQEELHDEFFWFLNHSGECKLRSNHNKIIQYFQQNNFYKKEKELWNNPLIKKRLISNRIKYLNKQSEELTTYDILSGFKKSGIYYGYSGFNPLLAKWFFEKYKCNSCYDPCGGWGHRMLGATELNLYIYNDASKSTSESVQNIKDYFDMDNVIIYNYDARSFMPDYDFDCIFTCPPYFNIEHYECGDFNSIEDYNSLLNSIFDIYYKSNCRVMGIVLREDLMIDSNFNKMIQFGVHQSHLIKHKQNRECLYIYMKNK